VSLIRFGNLDPSRKLKPQRWKLNAVKWLAIVATVATKRPILIMPISTYFSNMLCAVKLRVLGCMAYWYTGSAFHQIPQPYLCYSIAISKAPHENAIKCFYRA